MIDKLLHVIGEKKKKHTQLSQQLINSLYDVGFEGGKMLSEVLLAESSSGQQLVEGFLLVGLFTAASRSEGRKIDKSISTSNFSNKQKRIL